MTDIKIAPFVSAIVHGPDGPYCELQAKMEPTSTEMTQVKEITSEMKSTAVLEEPKINESTVLASRRNWMKTAIKLAGLAALIGGVGYGSYNFGKFVGARAASEGFEEIITNLANISNEARNEFFERLVDPSSTIGWCIKGHLYSSVIANFPHATILTNVFNGVLAVALLRSTMRI